jgi:WD40 repeat protein
MWHPALIMRRENVYNFALPAGPWQLFFATTTSAGIEFHRARLDPVYEESVYSASKIEWARSMFVTSDGEVAIVGLSSGDVGLLRARDHQMKILLSGVVGTLVSGTPDGRKFVASGSDGLVRYWTADDFGSLSLEPVIIQRHAKPIGYVGVLSAPLRVFASDEDGVVGLTDLESDLQVQYKHGEQLSAEAVSPDGNYLATGGNGSAAIRIWPARLARERAKTSLDSALFHVAYSRDGNFAAAEGRNGSVFRWDMQSDAVREFSSKIEIAFGLALSPDGDRLAVATLDGVTRLWLPAASQSVELDTKGERTWDLAFSHDGSSLATVGANGNVSLWNRAGTLVCRWKVSEHALRAVSFAAAAEVLVAVGEGAWLINIEDACEAKPIKFESPDGTALKVAFSRDGRHFVTGSSDGIIRLWDVANVKSQVIARHSGSVKALEMSADSATVLSASEDGSVMAVDIRSDKSKRLELGHNVANDIALSQTEHRAAIACQDGAIRVWNYDDESLCTLRGHRGFAVGVDIRGDGTRALSVGWDGVLREWLLPDQCPTPERGSLERFLSVLSRDSFSSPSANLLTQHDP